MHVLFVTAYYPSPESPVTGIFFHDQALGLHRAGHKVGVLVTPRLNVTLAHVKRHGVSQLAATTRDDDFFKDFPVYRMHWGWFPRPFPFVIAPLLASAGKRAFERYVREQGMPDVIHGHNIFYGGYLATILSKQYHIPAVVTEYSSGFAEGHMIFPGQAGIIQRSLRVSKANMVCGSSLIEPLKGYTPEQDFETLGCIVDTDFFSPVPAAAETPFTFVVIAQLKERRKRFDLLLKAFASAFKGQPDVVLQIRGQGPLRAELDQLIAELGIGAQVEFLPMMTKPELRDLIRRSHSLISSSDIETFGVSVAELIACGRPVVSTISGGPEDFVTERSGILIPTGSAEALAVALQQMKANYSHYRPEEVRRDVSERYSEPVYVGRLEAIYQRARAAH